MSGALKTFRGKNVAEAMRKVRAELGSDAFVVEKRELKQSKSFFKLGGEELVEITATDNPEIAHNYSKAFGNAPRRGTLLEKTYGTFGSAPATTVTTPGNGSVGLAAGDSPAVGGLAGLAGLAGFGGQKPSANVARKSPFDSDVEVQLGGAGRPAPARQVETDTMRTPAAACADAAGVMMAALREQVLRLTCLQARGGIPAVGENLLDAYQLLVENEVNAAVARELVEDLQREMGGETLEREAVLDGLARSVAAQFRPGSIASGLRRTDRPEVVALVGPGGSGKTTTLVKIAFELAINQKKKVGIINEDFRRAGAAAQLQGLIQIMDLPLVTIDSAARLGAEVANMSGLDLVLVDTAGRGPRDQRGLAELGQMLEAAQPDQTHLVIPMNTTEKAALSLVNAFRPYGMDRIILSKLDEAASCGLALSLAREVPEEMSYITLGQKWSGGLSPADPVRLAGLVLGLEDLAGLGE